MEASTRKVVLNTVFLIGVLGRKVECKIVEWGILGKIWYY
jgi:hypothetical protein